MEKNKDKKNQQKNERAKRAGKGFTRELLLHSIESKGINGKTMWVHFYALECPNFPHHLELYANPKKLNKKNEAILTILWEKLNCSTIPFWNSHLSLGHWVQGHWRLNFEVTIIFLSDSEMIPLNLGSLKTNVCMTNSYKCVIFKLCYFSSEVEKWTREQNLLVNE